MQSVVVWVRWSTPSPPQGLVLLPHPQVLAEPLLFFGHSWRLFGFLHLCLQPEDSLKLNQISSSTGLSPFLTNWKTVVELCMFVCVEYLEKQIKLTN